MAMGKAMGPGDRVARANKKLGKAVSKLPASRDTPIERREKMANIEKTNVKVAKRADKLAKVVGKSADKIVDKARKGKFNSAQDMVSSYIKKSK